MKEFPTEYQNSKEVEFYPAEVEKIEGDILEIGPGRGDFLYSLAERYPDKKITAVEIANLRFKKLVSRVKKRELSNITLIRGAAQVTVPRFCAEGSFERVYVLFPDPWPKRRHAQYRLLSVDYLSRLARLLTEDGQFFFATDFRDYANEVVANIEATGEFSIIGNPFSNQEAITDYFPSLFEKRWRDEGREILYLCCRRQCS